MPESVRLEIRMPVHCRDELMQLADEADVSIGWLMRLAATRLLDDRQSLLEAIGRDHHARAVA